MKILHVCPHFYPCIGGIERHVEDLCVNLFKLGHTSNVCCLNTCAYSNKTLPARGKRRGTNIFRLPHINLKYYKINPKILKIVKGYDVIHIHGLGFFCDILTMTKRFHKKPLILSTHGGIFHTKKFKVLKKLYFSAWSRMILKKIDKVIAVSKSDYGQFSKIVPKNKMNLIENGIYFERFSKIKRMPEKDLFIYIGRISKNKRIDRLIKVFAHIANTLPNARLLIIGSDWQGIQKELQALVTAKGLEKQINFTGAVGDKELVNYLKRAEFFVSASEYEGFGIAVLEAMAAGMPVIVNDIPAFRHFVKNQRNGFIVNYANPFQAASKILQIVKRRDLSKISEASRATAKEYDWAKLIKKFEGVYKAVCL